MTTIWKSLGFFIPTSGPTGANNPCAKPILKATYSLDSLTSSTTSKLVIASLDAIKDNKLVLGRYQARKINFLPSLSLLSDERR